MRINNKSECSNCFGGMIWYFSKLKQRKAGRRNSRGQSPSSKELTNQISLGSEPKAELVFIEE